jgi:peptidoglycan hydrolase CwlO-like protein
MAHFSLIYLVVGVIVVIVLRAWLVRRMAFLRLQARNSRERYEHLRSQATELANDVGELDHGLRSNAASIQSLEEEIEQLKQTIEEYSATEQD